MDGHALVATRQIQIYEQIFVEMVLCMAQTLLRTEMMAITMTVMDEMGHV